MRIDSREMLARGIFGRASLRERVEMLVRREGGLYARVSGARVIGGVSMLMMLAAAGSVAPRWIAFAQKGNQPAFEVASIRLSRNPAPGGEVEITPGRFHGEDLALQWLILTAFRVKSGNLSGNLPVDDASGEERVLQALQGLLRDRFKLTEHREARDEPVYFLKTAKSGIRMPVGSCVPVKKDLPNECYSVSREGLVEVLDWRGVSLSAPEGIAYRSLVWQLSGSLRRTVIDKTGLTGTYDVHLRWAVEPPDRALPASLPEAPPLAPPLPRALEEQAGLRLESGRGPVEYMIVDRVEKPDAN